MAIQRPSEGIDLSVYNAAICPATKIKESQLRAALNSITLGSRNTLLHLAASAGNLQFVQDLLKLNPLLLKATNAQGNTPLHMAAHGGFSKVVEILLQQPDNGVDVCNNYNEKALFKAYESGNLDTVKALFKAYPQGLSQRTAKGRTCLYAAVIKGKEDLVKDILDLPDVARELIQVNYTNDDTALHTATGRR